MELQHLQYFLEVARYQHMTRAAEELHVAQSALSRLIKGLENELGCSLFDRRGRNLILNKNGQILLKYTQNIFNQFKDMKRELSYSNGRQQDVTITMMVKVASKFLPEIISGFNRLHPEARFVIIQNEALENMQQPWDICLDAGMELQEDKFSICVLKEEICLAMPRNHPLAARKSIRLEEVAGESFLGMQKGSSMNEIATFYCHKAGFEPHSVLTSDNPATLRGMLSLGLGIVFNPIITWKEVSEEEFSLVPIEGHACFRYIYLHLRPNGYTTPLVQDFKKYLINFFRTLAVQAKKDN